MRSAREKHIALIAKALPQVTVALALRHPVQAGDWEITMAQMRALMAVGWESGCTMGELAARLGIGLSAATGLADRLVEAGALVRESDPSDRRVVRVRMSPAGLRAGQEYQAAEVRHIAAVLSALADGEVRLIAEAASLLLRAVKGG